MIEDKESGLKVAKDKTEELWINLEQRATQAILQSKVEIKIQNKILELCKTEIER